MSHTVYAGAAPGGMIFGPNIVFQDAGVTDISSLERKKCEKNVVLRVYRDLRQNVLSDLFLKKNFCNWVAAVDGSLRKVVKEE
jgi:hypothetical protein